MYKKYMPFWAPCLKGSVSKTDFDFFLFRYLLIQENKSKRIKRYVLKHLPAVWCE